MRLWMSLETWDPSRKKWILYRNSKSHSADCECFPFSEIPRRVFLDTNVVNLLIKYSSIIFEMEVIPMSLPEMRSHEIEALMHIFYVGQRASWDLVASAKTMEEISKTRDSSVREELLEYVSGLIEVDTQESQHGADFGRRLADATIAAALPDRDDRELLGNAIGLDCDAFCTCDHRTIVSKRHLLPKLPLRILTPIEWWAHVKPWAGLW